MSTLKITTPSLTVLRIILVVFMAIFILVLPQLNIQAYVLPTITSKLIYFLYGSMILLGVYTFIVIFSKTIVLLFSKIDIALFTLVLYITLNRYSIQSYYGFSICYIELLVLIFFYVVLRYISLKSYPWLLLSIVVSGIIQAVYGNLQLLGFYTSNHSGFKMTGSFFNPGPFAGFLVSVWTVALGMYLFKDNITNQVQRQIKNRSLFFNKFIEYIFEYIPLLGLISIFIILPVLQSRASWISALVSSGFLMELKYHFLQNRVKKIKGEFVKTTLILLSIGILSSGLFNLYYYKKSSSDGRVFIWKVTTKMIADNPVFGVGFDQFKTLYMNYQANHFDRNGETLESLVADNTNYAFNEWLQFLAENGLLGFLLLLIVVFVLIQTKVKYRHKVMALISKSVLAAICIFACFSYPMQILPIKMVIIFLVAMLANSTSYNFQFNIKCYSSKRLAFKISFVTLSYVIIYQTYTYTRKIDEGFKAWNNALKSHQYGDYNGAIQEFDLAYPILKKDGDFLMNYGKTLSMAKQHNKAIIVLEQAKHYRNNIIIATALGDSYKATRQYNKAEKAYQQAINMAPGKFYANYLLAKLFDASGQEAEAVTMAKKLLNKEIKIPSTAIREIQGEMKKILIKYKNPLDLKIK
jgi:O-antigen polymerase